jgi:hypothetical protein
MNSLVFSKSKEGTVIKVVTTTTTITNTSGLSYNMIDRLANSSKCGKCRGAK